MWHVAFVIKVSDCEANPMLTVVLTEFFRYSGVASTSIGDHSVYLPFAAENHLRINHTTEKVIVIHEPKSVNGTVWAHMNADRIRSFGVKAVAFKQ